MLLLNVYASFIVEVGVAKVPELQIGCFRKKKSINFENRMKNKNVFI